MVVIASNINKNFLIWEKEKKGEGKSKLQHFSIREKTKRRK